MNIESISKYKEEYLAIILGVIQAIIINILVFSIANILKYIPNNVLVFGEKPLSLSHIFYVEIILGIISIIVLIFLTINYPKSLKTYFGYFTIGIITICFLIPILITFASIQLILFLELMNVISAICIYSSVSRRIFNK